MGRLTRRDMRGANRTVSERFFYDARGRLSTAQTEDSTVRLHYDAIGNLVAEEQHVHVGLGDSYVSVTRHEHDALGHRIRTTLPNTRTLDWLRYGSGHVHGVLVDGAPETARVAGGVGVPARAGHVRAAGAAGRDAGASGVSGHGHGRAVCDVSGDDAACDVFLPE